MAAWLFVAVVPSQTGAEDLAAQLASRSRAEVFVMLREPMKGARSLNLRRDAIASQQERVAGKVAGPDVAIHSRLATVSAFTASVSGEGLALLRAQPDVVRVDPIKLGSGGLSHSVPQIRADAVHRRDDEGQTVTIAILDTGVDASHPDLMGSVVGEQCFCSGGCCPNGLSQQSGEGSAHTDFVHGIHVAGIALSRGHVAPLGVAPQTSLVAVKVLDENNRGSLLDWVRGLDWIISSRPDVQAINMSLVSDATYMGDCDNADSFNMAFAQALGILRARGTLAFVSSGNTGDLEALTSPACVHDAVAVGAVDRDDQVADFSSVSSSLDLLAPGVDIVSSGPNGTTATLSGTSMAAPHATGTAALLLALNPKLSADELEGVLKQRGTKVFDERVNTVFPRVNALAAMSVVLPTSHPFAGGGSRRTDCLLEWDVAGSPHVQTSPRLSFTCRDNDPSCDQDSTAGQCTFQLTTCVNVADQRLPHCSAAAPLTSYRLVSPSTTAGDPGERSNANALLQALPALGSAAGTCSSPFSFGLPVGGPRWIRLSAVAGDGRRDADRVQLTCTP